MSHASPTPSTRTHDSFPQHGRFAAPRPNSHTANPSNPVPIPNAQDSPPAPPPLPPPTTIDGLDSGRDLAWQFANGHQQRHFDHSTPNSHQSLHNRPSDGGDRVTIGATSVGGPREGEERYRSPPRNRYHTPTNSFHERDGNADRVGGGDRQGVPKQPVNSNYRLQGERQLGQIALENSSQAYDKQQLSKIGGPKAPSTGSVPSSNPESLPKLSLAASAPNSHVDSLPFLGHRQVPTETTERWPAPRAPSDASNAGNPAFEASAASGGRKHSHGNASSGDETMAMLRPREDSSDHGVFPESELSLNENSMRELKIEDRRSPVLEDYHVSSSGALKRRASSPPSEASRDDRSVRPSIDYLYQRRSAHVLTNRNLPGPKYHAPLGSLVSATSASQKAGSYASSCGRSSLSSFTSYNSDRILANTLSPSSDVDVLPSPSFRTNSSLDYERKVTVPKTRIQNDSEPPQGSRRRSTDIHPHNRQGSLSKFQGHFICECCPKKPKKFESEEDLRAHEAEKQYTCQFCSNRFKNKNEAERHQNSLHLRRYSWSCAALAGVHAAFHPSTAHPAESDVCGYCGDDFPNPANWDYRADHLNNHHKYGECNQAKKFFRADHFRQHLKHSHAGSSGKWTNLLENACMKEESPLKERAGSTLIGSGAISSQNFKSNSGMISESHEES